MSTPQTEAKTQEQRPGWLWQLVRRFYKPTPKFHVGQLVKRTWEPETCWRRIDSIYEQYVEADECECCGQETPGRWLIEYVFDLGDGHSGALGIEWDAQMHAKDDSPNTKTCRGPEAKP